jgi:hypothetical protein
LTAAGETLLAGLDVDVAALRARRRPLTRTCRDLTERGHDHLAGAVGAAIATSMIDRGWIVRRPGTRAVTVTDAGHRGTERWLGVDLPAAA